MKLIDDEWNEHAKLDHMLAMIAWTIHRIPYRIWCKEDPDKDKEFEDFFIDFLFDGATPEKKQKLLLEKDVYGNSMRMKASLMSGLGVNPKEHDGTKPIITKSGVVYIPPGVKKPRNLTPPVVIRNMRSVPVNKVHPPKV